jgi:hypothetical protein
MKALTLLLSDDDVAAALLANSARISSELLLFETPTLQWEPSTVYDVASLVKAVQTARDGIAGSYLLANGVVGRLNVAAFLLVFSFFFCPILSSMYHLAITKGRVGGTGIIIVPFGNNPIHVNSSAPFTIDNSFHDFWRTDRLFSRFWEI